MSTPASTLEMRAAIGRLTDVRAAGPEPIRRALAARPPYPLGAAGTDRLMVIAADHPARGALAAGTNPRAL
ncbi:MAG: hypothetical protein LBK72_04145, partial [Bifidobacteriaceae bacterium]|nr:hypothetical protein [Bifidobacteriaceae bacterium]